jgi:hypothetical protein
MRNKLLVPGIGSWGQLLEWMTKKKDAVLDTKNDHHRHTSHLFAVFPGHQISYATAPKLADAAKVYIFQNLNIKYVFFAVLIILIVSLDSIICFNFYLAIM